MLTFSQPLSQHAHQVLLRIQIYESQPTLLSLRFAREFRQKRRKLARRRRLFSDLQARYPILRSCHHPQVCQYGVCLWSWRGMPHHAPSSKVSLWSFFGHILQNSELHPEDLRSALAASVLSSRANTFVKKHKGRLAKEHLVVYSQDEGGSSGPITFKQMNLEQELTKKPPHLRCHRLEGELASKHCQFCWQVSGGRRAEGD